MIGVLFTYLLLVCLFSGVSILDEEQLINFQDLEFEQQLAKEPGKCPLIMLNLNAFSLLFRCIAVKIMKPM